MHSHTYNPTDRNEIYLKNDSNILSIEENTKLI